LPLGVQVPREPPPGPCSRRSRAAPQVFLPLHQLGTRPPRFTSCGRSRAACAVSGRFLIESGSSRFDAPVDVTSARKRDAFGRVGATDAFKGNAPLSVGYAQAKSWLSSFRLRGGMKSRDVEKQIREAPQLHQGCRTSELFGRSKSTEVDFTSAGNGIFPTAAGVRRALGRRDTSTRSVEPKLIRRGVCGPRRLSVDRGNGLRAIFRKPDKTTC